MATVPLTLKATASLLGFRKRRIWVTSWVKGPVPISLRIAILEAELCYVRRKPSSGGSSSTDMSMTVCSVCSLVCSYTMECCIYQSRVRPLENTQKTTNGRRLQFKKQLSRMSAQARYRVWDIGCNGWCCEVGNQGFCRLFLAPQRQATLPRFASFFGLR